MTRRYSPEGAVVLGEEGPVTHLACSGDAVYDFSTGLIYKGGKYYDPGNGNWLTGSIVIPFFGLRRLKRNRAQRRREKKLAGLDRWSWFWLLVLFVMLLAGCGSGDSSPSPSPSPTATETPCPDDAKLPTNPNAGTYVVPSYTDLGLQNPDLADGLPLYSEWKYDHLVSFVDDIPGYGGSRTFQKWDQRTLFGVSQSFAEAIDRAWADPIKSSPNWPAKLGINQTNPIRVVLDPSLSEPARANNEQYNGLNIIFINPKFGGSATQIVIHEMAHLIDGQGLMIQQLNLEVNGRYDLESNKDVHGVPPTTYGKYGSPTGTSYATYDFAEDFAESVTSYFYNDPTSTLSKVT